MKKTVLLLALLAALLLPLRPALAAEGFSLYGFTLDQSPEQALQNARDKGLTIEGFNLPERNGQASDMHQQALPSNLNDPFQRFLSALSAVPGQPGIPPSDDLYLVDKNLVALASYGELPLGVIRVYSQEVPQLYLYFARKDGQWKCFAIEPYGVNGLDVYLKDMQSLFTERYGAPTPSQAPEEPAEDPRAISANTILRNLKANTFSNRLAGRVEPTTPEADCWERNGNCAVITKDFTSAMLLDSGLTREVFQQILSLVRAKIDEQQKAKQEQENAASQKRKSMM